MDRNGFLPERALQTPVGSIEIRKPRVNDRRVDEDGNRIKFTSMILPPYLRRAKALEELIPWLYLKGISTGDFPEALAALLGRVCARTLADDRLSTEGGVDHGVPDLAGEVPQGEVGT